MLCLTLQLVLATTVGVLIINAQDVMDGGWSNWSDFGACSATCGKGTHTRHRTCTNPAPSDEGKTCEDQDSDEQECVAAACPADGGWSEWSDYGPCSVTCGKGTETRSRSCNKPSPAAEGKECEGSSIDHQDCESGACSDTHVVDGGWSDWTTFGPCNAKCGAGKQARHRKCNHPKPSGVGGKVCVGPKTTRQNCTAPTSCPVHGHWSTWSAFGKCSITCGGGTHTRTRTCNHPAPSAGGKDCAGNNTHHQPCGAKKCPEPKSATHWDKWNPAGPCSVTCGSGTQPFSRSCITPPGHSEQHCTGQSSKTVTCNQGPCLSVKSAIAAIPVEVSAASKPAECAQWLKYSNNNSPGGDWAPPQSQTVEQCQQACAHDQHCLAIDFDRARPFNCWLHRHVAYDETRWYTPDVDQYVKQTCGDSDELNG